MFQGLYYTAGLEQSEPGGKCGGGAFYGSLLADGTGNQIVHRRLASPLCYVIDYQTDEHTTTSSDQYAFSADGKAFVSIGSTGTFSLTVGVRATDFSGGGGLL